MRAARSWKSSRSHSQVRLPSSVSMQRTMWPSISKMRILAGVDEALPKVTSATGSLGRPEDRPPQCDSGMNTTETTALTNLRLAYAHAPLTKYPPPYGGRYCDRDGFRPPSSPQNRPRSDMDEWHGDTRTSTKALLALRLSRMGGADSLRGPLSRHNFLAGFLSLMTPADGAALFAVLGDGLRRPRRSLAGTRDSEI